MVIIQDEIVFVKDYLAAGQEYRQGCSPAIALFAPFSSQKMATGSFPVRQGCAFVYSNDTIETVMHYSSDRLSIRLSITQSWQKY
jgi:hypothetical protein